MERVPRGKSAGTAFRAFLPNYATACLLISGPTSPTFPVSEERYSNKRHEWKRDKWGTFDLKVKDKKPKMSLLALYYKIFRNPKRDIIESCSGTLTLVRIVGERCRLLFHTEATIYD